MRAQSLFVSIVAAASAVLGTTDARGNLLVNSSFETGNFAGWSTIGTLSRVGVAQDATLIPDTGVSHTPAFVNTRTGDWAAYGSIAAVAGEYLGLSQLLTLSGGMYTAGFYIGNDSPSAFDIDLAITLGTLAVLVDDAIVPFSVRPANVEAGSTSADLQELGISFVAAPGVHKVEFRLTAGNLASRVGASFDDFYVLGDVGTVSAPSSLALLALGLSLAWARSRRR